MIVQTIGTFMLAYDLWKLMLCPSILGAIIVYFAKLWFLDRMVWLFDEMKTAAEYQKLDY